MRLRYSVGQRLTTLIAALLSSGSLLAQAPRPVADPLPFKYAGPPTGPEITAGDLMTRVYKFADDSMMGRTVGTIYNDMGTAYIESELRRLGLQPAGEDGTFFQKLPLVNRVLDSASTITVDTMTFRAFQDFVALGNDLAMNLASLPMFYVGSASDTLDIPPVDSLRGKLAIVRLGQLAAGTDPQAFLQSAGYQRVIAAIEAANVIMLVGGPQLSPGQLRGASNPAGTLLLSREGTAQIAATPRVAEAILGTTIAEARRGQPLRPVQLNIRMVDTQKPGRNVIAVLPGTDPALRGQYVAIGAHSDHVPPVREAADHDSLRAYLKVVRPQGADTDPRPATAEENARIRAMLDSARAANAPRVDSIRNGADDDASGSMTVLEIAEAFARGPVKPRRSVLFVWHTGEEAGLWGAEHFTANPTVPRDSIVAQLNMDMVGRGGAMDVTGESKDGGLLRGGPGYVQLIGSRRLSTELGDIIEAVNREKGLGLTFDYSMDANGHPQNIYCRSDHYEYAKYGIPVAFITTGGHADYHQVTDEPQYLDYPHMAQVARLVFETALRVGNLDHRVVVDKPKPDPKGTCVQ
ncbi:MAG TPA: M28 family peptidase [Gemmatimonadaceae bacterium]|nr:M28 family peptidase [Gemmatimonadaceae bacterium]